MSLLESRRGIAEAESVTKLTELAFLFIPLTFSAALFSMQIEEFQSSSPSLWAFVLVAVTITASSYALRLAVRSHAVVSMREMFIEQLRDFSNSEDGSPIQTRAFFQWVRYWISTRSLAAHTLAASCAIGIFVSIGLLAALWKGSLHKEMKFAFTVFVCVLWIFMLAFIVFSVLMNGTWKRLFPWHYLVDED